MRSKLKIEKQKTFRLWRQLLSVCCIGCCLLVVVASCSDDDIIDNGNDKEIRFGLSKQSRATVTDAGNLDTIGVFGYYTATERWIWSANNTPANLKANYFLNELVTKTGSGDWVYDGPKYWPPDTVNKLSFFAYAPYVETDEFGLLTAADSITPYPYAKTQSGEPYLTYVVPLKARDQVDLIWDSKLDMTKDWAPVIFDMKHALTRLSFSAIIADSEWMKNYTAKITEISVSGVYGSGDLNLVTGEWTYMGTNDAEYKLLLDTATPANSDLEDKLFNATQSTDVQSSPSDSKKYDLNKSDAYLMLLSQTITDDAMLNITLEITFTSQPPISSGLSIPIRAITPEWLAGQAIEFKLLIKGEFISVTTTLIPWIPSTGSGDAIF